MELQDSFDKLCFQTALNIVVNIPTIGRQIFNLRCVMQNFDNSMKQNKCERGKKMQVVIEISKEVLYDTKQTIEQATDFAKSVTALGFYKQYGV